MDKVKVTKTQAEAIENLKNNQIPTNENAVLYHINNSWNSQKNFTLNELTVDEYTVKFFTESRLDKPNA